MSTDMIKTFNAEQTARLLDIADLVEILAHTVKEYSQGSITAPERQAVQFPQGGVLLSMPATAHDIGIHKLVNVVAGNGALNLPTIHGLVSAYDGKTGKELFILDGPTVTARRTAAISMLGLRTFLNAAPSRVALIGTGSQSAGHAEALAAMFPDASVVVIGSSLEKARAFRDAHAHLALRLEAGTAVPDDVQAVITLTTSSTPVYREPARAGRLVIGVGAYKADLAEIAAETLLASQLYVDDPAGARHEAGDLIQAGADWSKVKSLGDALLNGVDLERPIVFKTVGCAAWDLGAARCALKSMEAGQRPDGTPR